MKLDGKIIYIAFALLIMFSCSKKKNGNLHSTQTKEIICAEKFYKQDEFSLKKPANWHVEYTGSCSSFAFAVFDSLNPEIRAFFVHSLGPVYLSLPKKRSDLALIKSYGFQIPHFAMPVIDPFTPSKFLLETSKVLEIQENEKYKNICPNFKKAKIINTEETEALFHSSKTEIIHLIFTSHNQVLEGLVTITTLPDLNSEGENISGLGNAYMIVGVCAPPEKFEYNVCCLFEILQSFHLEEQVYQDCVSGETYLNLQIAKAGKWLGNSVSALKIAWNNIDETDKDLVSYYTDSTVVR